MGFYHVLSMESHGFMILHRSCLMTTAHWDANPRELNHFESRSTLPMGVNHFLTPVGSKIITSNGWWIQKKKLAYGCKPMMKQLWLTKITYHLPSGHLT